MSIRNKQENNLEEETNNVSNEDLVEKSIADAKKVRQIALKSAEKSLIEKYSKDLKKMYLQKLTEDFDVDLDLEPDVQQLDEEYNMMAEEEDPLAQPGQNDPFVNIPGGEDPDGLTGDPMAPGGGSEMPGQQDAGPMGPNVDPMAAAGGGEAPDPNTMGNAMGNIPYDHEAGEKTCACPAEDEEIEFALDFDAQSEGDMTDFENQQNMRPPGLGESLDVNLFKPESLQINDNILLDYIERSLRNDGVVKQLKEDLEILSLQLNQLQEALSSSNKTMKELSQQNARLLYKNEVLSDDSLSEHQKNHIVKALDKAETLKEAKAIYETAKVMPKSKNSSQNIIDKALGNKATGTTNLIRESQKKPEMIEGAERWQELAGIKKK